MCVFSACWKQQLLLTTPKQDKIDMQDVHGRKNYKWKLKLVAFNYVAAELSRFITLQNKIRKKRIATESKTYVDPYFF